MKPKTFCALPMVTSIGRLKEKLDKYNILRSLILKNLVKVMT